MLTSLSLITLPMGFVADYKPPTFRAGGNLVYF